MRLDKFLKVSRLIKRRTEAKKACLAKCIRINNRIAKAGDEVKIGDEIEINFANKSIECPSEECSSRKSKFLVRGNKRN